jgi:hypothetical protein
MHFALKFFEADPSRRELPPESELPYTFVFRFALCAYLHALHWIAAGGAKDRPLKKFRNDFIDVAFAAYGPTLRRILNFLIGDRWTAGFRSRPPKFERCAPQSPPQQIGPPFDSVNLFSGGLDSLHFSQVTLVSSCFSR